MYSRHSCLNDFIKGALLSAEILSLVEPPGVLGDNDKNKRIYGIAIIPWKKGTNSTKKACSPADATVLKNTIMVNQLKMYIF